MKGPSITTASINHESQAMTHLSGGSFADDDGLHLDLEGVEALLVRQVQLVAQLAAHLLQRLRLGRLLLELGLPHHRQLQPEGREQKNRL